jgi:Fe-Mn family superoxide dismutase
MIYTARSFNLPELKGISKKQVDVHLGLYEGYVKHANLIMEKIKKLSERDDESDNAFVAAELRRRVGFEFDGMRMHEYYFEQFEGGPSPLNSTDGPLLDAVKDKYGNWDTFISGFKEICGTRGPGWTIVYYDPAGRTMHTAWIEEHQMGQLAGLPILLAIDMWEHAFMVDYMPSEKKSYIDAFLENVNWDVVEKRFLREVV